MTVADIYGRKSTDDRGKSVADQLTEAQEAIQDQGWTLGRVFSDDNRSASRFARKKREDFAELLAHIESGGCELLILWESSRGSRKLAEWAGFLDLIRERGVLIYIVSHGRTYDCRIGRDWKILATDGVDAHAESNLISDRALRGKRRGAAAGKPAGKLQFGFRRVYNDAGEFVEQVEHPEQAALVREAARRVLAGEACNAIAADFNARGILTPRYEPLMARVRRNREEAALPSTSAAQRAELLAEAETWEKQAAGLRWDLTQIKRLCVMPAYAGLRVHQGQVIGKAGWKGIHDEATYAKLLARLTDPKRRTQRDSALKHVLSGLIRCALCASDMRVLKNRGYLCYTCKGCMKTSVRTVTVEGFVEELVLARLERDDAADLFASPGSDDKAAEARRELEELNGQLAEWKALAKARKVSPASFAEFEADLLPQIEAAEVRAKAARVAPVPETIRKLIGAPRKRWPELTVYQRREAIGLLVVELKVGPVGRGRRIFDPARLGASRWTGDALTWAEHWAAEFRARA
ncbi:recombinase family protein [Micromonospora halophytica]|nr:recombinase family protein [Micromonospora halophytica]